MCLRKEKKTFFTKFCGKSYLHSSYCKTEENGERKEYMTCFKIRFSNLGDFFKTFFIPLFSYESLRHVLWSLVANWVLI